MLKNNKGVTLSILVVTIIVIMILAGITVTTSNLLIRDTKAKATISNMYLLKGKIEALYDDFQFSGKGVDDANNGLVGDHVSSSSVSQYYTNPTDAPSGTAADRWFKIVSSDLPDLGMDTSMLPSSAFYYVNYETGEVIYSSGFTDSETGVKKYKLSDV